MYGFVKMIKQCLLINILFSTCTAEEVNLNFFQNDYDIKMDIFDCPQYNKSLYKYLQVGLGWYNRTQRVINVKYEYLVEIGNATIVDAQLYKMMSNEYRFFPLTFKANACVEYKKDSFGLKHMLNECSNIKPCELKKNFRYAINNLIPDASKFPPRMPRGSYKLSLRFLYRSWLQAQVDFYGRVVDKPVDWKKISDSNKAH